MHLECVTDTATSPARPRPRQARKEARTAEIIAAGLREFARHGFEGARLDRIAEAANIAKGTVYLYFKSKDDLFAAAVEERVVTILDETVADFSTFEGTTEEILRFVIRETYDKLVKTEAIAIMHILISEGHRFPALVELYHTLAIKKGTALLQAIIDRGLARGEIRPNAAAKIPDLIIAPAVFFAINQRVFAKIHPLDLDDFIDGHIDLVLHGVLKG